MAYCDKCGEEVLPCDDVVHLDYLVGMDDPIYFVVAAPRHILCSPSRAQYLEGQDKDDRGFPYVPEMEGPYRKAYSRMHGAEYSAEKVLTSQQRMEILTRYQMSMSRDS